MSEDIKNGLIIDDYGNKVWYKNDKLHRVGGPAAKWHWGQTDWYKNGKLHRVGGPAIECDDGEKWWWLYNKEYKESEYNTLVSNLPLLYWNRFKEGKWI
jgi:hypothetical protein